MAHPLSEKRLPEEENRRKKAFSSAAAETLPGAAKGGMKDWRRELKSWRPVVGIGLYNVTAAAQQRSARRISVYLFASLQRIISAAWRREKQRQSAAQRGVSALPVAKAALSA